MEFRSCRRRRHAAPCPACSDVQLPTGDREALFHSVRELVDGLHVRHSTYAIIDAGRESRYVQVLADCDGALQVEAASNEATAACDPAAGLTAFDEIELLRLGYNPPDDGSPNWHRTFVRPWPWPAPVVAELLIRTLLDGFGAQPADLHVVVAHAQPGVTVIDC